MKRLLAIITFLSLAGEALAAPRLDYRGGGLGRSQAEALFAAALRAPGDSVSLVAALRRLVGGLQAAGYLDARARASWDSGGANPRLQVDAEIGERYRIASLAIDAASPAESLWSSPRRCDPRRRLGIDHGLSDALREAVRRAAGTGHPTLSWSSASARVGSTKVRASVSEARSVQG
jgi:hypothetical protein